MDGSVVFARLRQCVTRLTHSLGPPESESKTASRSVQPFLHSSPQSVPILYSGIPLKIAPSHWGCGPPSNTWFPGPTRVLIQNGISIGSAVIAGLTTVTDRQTDRPTDRATRPATIGRIYLRSTAMRPNNDSIYKNAVGFRDAEALM